MKKRLPYNRRGRAGFTLAETLITVLIVVMVAGVLAAGVPAAVNAYNNVVDSANAETLIGTTVTLLRSELGMASDISVENGKTLAYLNENNIKCSLEPGAVGDSTGIMLKCDDLNDQSQSQPQPLVSTQMATNGLYIIYRNVEYANGVVRFYGSENENGLVVLRDGKEIAGLRELQIRTFA